MAEILGSAIGERGRELDLGRQHRTEAKEDSFDCSHFSLLVLKCQVFSGLIIALEKGVWGARNY